MTQFVPIDQDVRERIRTDVEANLCVEAGAGTGKTTVLVDRVVEILRRGHATVDEIAVITFTEAAAAELSARVRQRLEEALDHTSDDEERDRVLGALQGLHRARVETIHAFAANLLRERPVEAGLDPQFEVMDELAAQVGFDEAYDDWLAELLSSPRPEVVTAVRRGFDLDQLRALVTEVHRWRSLLPLSYERAPAADVEAFRQSIANVAANLRALLPLSTNDEAGLRDAEQVVAFADRLAGDARSAEAVERAIVSMAPRFSPNKGAQKYWDDPQDCRDSKRLRNEAKQLTTAVQAALRTEALMLVFPVAEQFVAEYEARRKADGKADFDDLLEWARDLLADSREAREYFRRRFRTILVDEFQDTDPVQAEIVLCIASDDEPGDDWLRLRPRPGSLTVVGDPKQSIYRFRRADIAAYDAVRRGPLRDGEAQLVQNFRSVEGVLKWINTVFDEVLVEQEGVQPANTRLETGPAGLPDESLSICVLQGEEQKHASPVREEEARLLAGAIRRAIDGGWLVRDRSTGEVRPAMYRDVAMLVPRRTELDLFLEAFRRAGIPVRPEGGRSFFLRQEVRDLANMLQAIDDPLDRIALVATLRSVAFACADEEIFLYADAGNPLDYRVPARESSPPTVVEAMEMLSDLHDFRSRVSLAQLVREALERTRLVEIALAGWNGQQAAANLVKLADQARAFSAAGAGGLRAFAHWLERQRGGSDVAEASVSEEADDVVRVLTIHQAKGLEFPIVSLANLGSRPDSRVEPVPNRAEHRLDLRVTAPYEVKFLTPGFEQSWAGEEAQERAEDKRLLYVATTRARDHLILPIASQPTGKELLTDLLRFVPQREPGEEGERDGCYLIDRDLLPPVPEDEPAAPALADGGTVAAAVAARADWESAHMSLVAEARDELEVFPATRDEGDSPVPAALLGADDAPLITGEGPPLRKGEAMHKVLELIDLREPGDVEAIALSVCRVAGIVDAADEVAAMARACLASEPLARALRAGESWREVPYTVHVEGGYATGRIDLVFREADGVAVVDWKSDSVGPSQADAAAHLHREQGAAYVRALEAASRLRVREVDFVFARAGGATGTLPRHELIDA